ncbi:AlpA family phage regulatory protein [Aromatoleum toluolicum]|uniref:AlpA family phage regulatory protein n=1 Tax=Aromatoleum toluolicum TaxID=90060 RepID=A0ABX1NA38_9RHOO|nr:AlpA family phage regulatory protein [Aromatoleum toluolicum]NMF96134.1 AlpA family phage regulatory protein [Aromatoleum toluolicum]
MKPKFNATLGTKQILKAVSAAHPAPPSKDLPPALAKFDDLPESAYVRMPVVKELLSCSEATVWRMAKDGRLPRPHKYSTNMSGWNVGELRRAIRNA